MAKEMEIDDKLLATGEKKKITTPTPGIKYLNGKRYLMTGNSVSVDLTDGANYIKIYAEHDDIRIGINARASPDSPMIAFGGLVPEIIDTINNLETMAFYGTAGQYCSVSFFRRDV
jgi:hypothetical protein